ncbi:MAG: phosphate ABC transporter substrate-binding protein [Caldilineaceae bacterium]|nr:phosphate ABC transporter substrate-binding protein [Caldilineaceae bacterium]
MIRRRTLLAWLILLLMTAPAACSQTVVSTPAPETVTIAGATSMRPVLHELTAAYTRQHPNVLFDVRGGGSTLGEERVARGEIDIAATTLLPTEDAGDPGEDAAAIATPDPLVRTPIGLDGVAVVVHASNPITNVTVTQLRDIYAGRTLDWAELGAPDGEILLVSREDRAGTRRLFDTRIMGDVRVSLTAVVMPTSADVVEYVGRHPQAIGYVSAAYAAAPDSGVRMVPVEDKVPSVANVLSQEYWLIQPLFLATEGQPTGRVRQFIDFALSGPGQEIVARYHAPVR